MEVASAMTVSSAKLLVQIFHLTIDNEQQKVKEALCKLWKRSKSDTDHFKFCRDDAFVML